jgi:hypothetical protein
MRTDLVVIDPPGLDDAPRVVETEKPVLVEGLIAQLAVEALDVGVLNRLAGPDEVQLYAPLVGPGVPCLAS